jgi:DNA end-binding protein Ku
VSIPVSLHAADRPDELHLTMLDKHNHSPIGYSPVNKATGRAVARADIVKGYELTKGRYVLVEDDDLRRANVKATQTVSIVSFVPRDTIEPLYYDRPYYLAPGKKGEKSYALLRETLKRTERAGIATVVIHTRQHVAAVYPLGDVLVLNLLRYGSEIRDAGDLGLPSGNLHKLGVTAKELDLAKHLVEGMEEDRWRPAQYHDSYRDDLLAFIKRKSKAGRVETAPEEAEEAASAMRESGQVLDLMALLKQSLEESKTPAQRRPSAARRSPARASTKKRRAG